MPTVLDIREVVEYIKGTQSIIKRAMAKAHLATVVKAEGLAKQNATRQFIGRNDRTLSGSLLNSIYSGFEKDSDGKTVGFVGVRNVPYGAVQEFGTGGLPGGVIKPVKAKKLWLPQYKNAGKMTPREFIRMKIQNPDAFFLNENVAGKWDNPNVKTRRLIPLFFLVEKVKIPARPYIRPGIEAAIEFFPAYFEKFMEEETP